jgi:hypothetical protein
MNINKKTKFKDSLLRYFLDLIWRFRIWFNWNIIINALLIIVVVALICVGTIIYLSLKEQTRIEKGCGEEYTTMTSETFKCPVDKPYVHLSIIGNSASVICCAKE